MKGWATPEDVYAYWPSLANSTEMTDERIRDHIREAEEIVQVDLESQGFSPPFTGERVSLILKRLVVLKTLSTLLLYPFGDGGTPSRYTRTALDFDARYRAELAWATRTYRALEGIEKRTPWGPITG